MLSTDYCYIVKTLHTGHTVCNAFLGKEIHLNMECTDGDDGLWGSGVVCC